MVFYCATVGISTIHAAWAIFGNNMVAPVLTQKLEWDKEQEKLYSSLIGNMGIAGLGIGSIFGGFFISKGRRLAAFFMSAFILVGVGLSLILTVPTIMIGRFV